MSIEGLNVVDGFLSMQDPLMSRKTMILPVNAPINRNWLCHYWRCDAFVVSGNLL